jgi:hypothetical protein
MANTVTLVPIPKASIGTASVENPGNLLSERAA